MQSSYPVRRTAMSGSVEFLLDRGELSVCPGAAQAAKRPSRFLFFAEES